MRKTPLLASLAVAFALPVLASPARAQGGDIQPTGVRFDFDRPGLMPPRWSLEVHADGTGQYTAQPVTPGLDAAPPPKPIAVTSATSQMLFAVYPVVAEHHCETRQKNIANTGAKHIAFLGTTDGTTLASCDFNYSDTEALNRAAAAFQAIAATLQAGARLESKHRFDRLGLDAEISTLTTEVSAGRAMEVQNIAPVLQSLIDDERVIERVRRKAARLLEPSAPPAR